MSITTLGKQAELLYVVRNFVISYPGFYLGTTSWGRRHISTGWSVSACFRLIIRLFFLVHVMGNTRSWIYIWLGKLYRKSTITNPPAHRWGWWPWCLLFLLAIMVLFYYYSSKNSRKILLLSCISYYLNVQSKGAKGYQEMVGKGKDRSFTVLINWE